MPSRPPSSSLTLTVERGFEQTRLAHQLVIAAYELAAPLICRTVPAKPACGSAGARDARRGTPRRKAKGSCA